MPDYKEVARLALLRAGEIKAFKAHRMKMIRAVPAFFVMFMAFSFLLVTDLPTRDPPEFVKIPGNFYFALEDARVPLGAFSANEENDPLFTLPGYGKITVQAGAADVKMLLPNQEGNPCRLTFDIMLTGTGETLYASGMVEPGTHIEGFTLAKALEKGEYEAALTIRAYGLDDGAVLCAARVEFVITVE